MTTRMWVTAAFVVAGAVGGVLMTLFTSAELRDYFTLLTAILASLALVQTWMSSTAAAANTELARINEARKKYGWSIVLHPDGGHYVLRNIGTIAATDVCLKMSGDYANAAFLQHDGEVGPVIPPGQAKAFGARFPWRSRGNEIQVDWLPEGEQDRQEFNEVLEPTPNSIAAIEQKQRDRLDRAGEAANAEIAGYAAECRRLLIDLADAWASYLADPAASNKIRVQGIVGALPTNFAREIGHAVDVPRDHWGVHQWPFDLWFPEDPEGQTLLRENAAVIELIWNLRDVQIPVFVEGDRSQPPEPWPRLERALYGFRDLVRQRQSGERELRDGERDRQRRQDADRMFKQHRERSRGSDPTG